MDNLADFLKNGITRKMSLDDMVDVFEKMCDIPMENDMILFETGTFSFTGEPMFQFSLVRQFPNEDEEYYQVHLDVLYKPTSENKAFEGAIACPFIMLTKIQMDNYFNNRSHKADGMHTVTTPDLSNSPFISRAAFAARLYHSIRMLTAGIWRNGSDNRRKSPNPVLTTPSSFIASAPRPAKSI